MGVSWGSSLLLAGAVWGVSVCLGEQGMKGHEGEAGQQARRSPAVCVPLPQLPLPAPTPAARRHSRPAPPACRRAN